MKLLRSYPVGFLEEAQRESRPSLRVGSGVGALALSSFFLVDLLLVPRELWATAFTIRALCWLILTVVFVGTFLPQWRDHWSRPAALLSFWVTGGGVIAVTALAGGGASRYHEALLLTTIGWSTLRIPWKRWDPSLNFVLLCAAYDVVMMTFDVRGPVVVWATNNAMIWLGAVIAIALSELLARQRTQDFLFRNELAHNATRLAGLDRAKSRFFANLSHELRTPISLTLAPVEVMLEKQGGRLDAGQRETLQLVRRNGLRLLKMMDDLLALTLAEVGNLRLRMEMLDIGQLAHGLRMDLQQFVESKDLDLRIEVADGVVPVIGDAELIERVLVTFLGNAAKFSERGGEISLEISPAEHGGVLVIVRDTGTGIPADELPHIFEPFNQSNAESLGRPGGAGVGLALAKAVVELHGGTIGVSSTEGVGTTVRMTVPPHPPESAPVERRRRGMELVAGGGRGIETGLPEWHATFRTTSDYRLQALRDVTERPVRRSTTLAPAAAPRVLIVEDNPDMTRFLETILASEYRTITAIDAGDGVRAAVSHLPDVVVTDLEMPGRNGMEMVQDLRSDPRTATIPIVMLASSDAAGQRAPETGEKPDAYVPKPFKVNDLTGAINALVQQQERGRSASMAERDEALLYMASGITEAASSALSQLSHDGEDSDSTRTREVLRGLVESLTTFARPLDTTAVVVRGLTQMTEEAVGRLDRVRVKSLSNASVRVDPRDFMDLLRLLVRVGLEGTPAASVSVEITEDASSTATVRIRDGGPGVPPEHAQRLFYPFNEAVDPDVSTALAGYRRRIERLNGRLVIEHGERGESSFLIRLPALRPFGKN